MTKYKCVYYKRERLDDVGILPDGMLHNPLVVRAAVLAADARRHERRS
jgi:hypothetical protein